MEAGEAAAGVVDTVVVDLVVGVVQGRRWVEWTIFEGRNARVAVDGFGMQFKARSFKRWRKNLWRCQRTSKCPEGNFLLYVIDYYMKYNMKLLIRRASSLS